MVIKVKRSPVHGKGCFTDCNLYAGDFIGAINIVPSQRPNMHSYYLTDVCVVDFVNNFKFLNHNKNPNCAIMAEDKNPFALYLIATRNIKADSESTISYGEDWE